MGPFYAYKETRLDLDPSVPGSTIAIRLPSYGASARATKTAQNRSYVADIPVSEDENAFRQRHLASAASIYHRIHHKSPRSFLWRVLEDGKVLSVRAVDVCKPAPDTPEAHLTLRLSFPNQIKAHCIAFSDSEQHDVLTAFVLTESKHLYTLTLRPDYFRKASSTEDNVGDWCKSYLSSAFAFKAAHRLVALSADEVLISFIDGGLVRLIKPSGGDGSQWTERYYNEGGWSLRGIFQGNNTIRHGKQNLELSTATSISSPVITIDGMPYIFTVCLDHRLRVWNLHTGKVAFMGDILDQDLEPQEQAKQVIQPSYSQLVKVYENNGENALCVTFSPLGNGQFKFWNARPAPDGVLSVTDLFPTCHLEPLAPSSDLWTLADFSVAHDRSSAQSLRLWTLWKNNISYRVHKLEFHGGHGSISQIKSAWKKDWQAMAQETLLDAALPIILPSDPSDVTDQWLQFILAPGRFSTATIETGLSIYERGAGTSVESSRKASLSERLCSSIGSTASLSRAANGSLDYNQFRGAIDVQWRRFYRLLLELHGQRGEALSMVLDSQGELPEVILADGVVVIREGSQLEQIWHNTKRVPAGTEHVARPILAGSGFRDSVSDQFLHNCRTALLGENFEEPNLTGPARIRAFYDKCDFSNQIGDEEYNQLVLSLGGGFTNLTEEVYQQILGVFEGPKGNVQKKSAPFAAYGSKVILRGVQETIELQRNICLDQLIVLVLLEAEINHGEDGLGIESSSFFLQLLEHLKRLELINWLASTQISLPLIRMERSNSLDKNTALVKKSSLDSETITVLEGVFRHLFGAELRSHKNLAASITDVIIQICDPESREYETSPSSILGWLLFHERVDLALEFARFAGRDPFSVYMQGRVSLAANDVSMAALQFKKAAFGMATPDPKSHYSSSGYLGNTARESFNQGLAKYYGHIVSLFDKEKLFSYVIDFTRLALQFLRPDSNPNNLHLRTEMHSRLFNAAIQTSRFELAHSTLQLFTDSALQHSSLRILVTRMCESSNASELISLPFLTLQAQVDEVLTQKCSSIVDVTAGIPYHKILYAWRIRRNNFRGAASIALDRLQRLQLSGDGDKFINGGVGDGNNLDTPVTRGYVQLINALACVDQKQAWVLAEDVRRSGKREPGKRKVVTLDDVRRAYQEELDRVSAVGRGQFGVVGGDHDPDEMDIL